MKLNIFYIVGLLLLSIACNKSEIDNGTVLKIGQLEISNYQFERNKNREAPQQRTNEPENIWLKKMKVWEKDYIDKCYFTACAYEKGYDTLEKVTKSVEHMSKFMMVQFGGYLWNEVVAPEVEAFSELSDENIAKREKLFYFDIITCSNYNTLLKYTNNDTTFESVAEFKNLKKHCKENAALTSSYRSLKWPFVTLWKYKEAIYKMQPGEVSPLMNIGGNYIYLYLDHTEEIQLTEQEKKGLQQDLKIGIEEELDNRVTEQMLAEGKPELHEKNIVSLVQFINGGNDIKDYDKNNLLLSYYLNNNQVHVDYKTFIETHLHAPIQEVINSKDKLNECLLQQFYNDCLDNQAKELGLYQSTKFLLDKKLYTENVMRSEFFLNEIYNAVNVDSTAAVNYYEENKSLYKQPARIEASIFSYNTYGEAMQNRESIKIYLDSIDYQSNDMEKITFNLEEDSSLSANFVNELISLKINTLPSSPIEYNNDFVWIYKHGQEGNTYRKFTSLYEQILNSLFTRKADDKKKNLLNELKQKYEIELNKTGIEL